MTFKLSQGNVDRSGNGFFFRVFRLSCGCPEDLARQSRNQSKRRDLAAKNAKVTEKNNYFFVFYAFFVVSPSDRKFAQATKPFKHSSTKVSVICIPKLPVSRGSGTGNQGGNAPRSETSHPPNSLPLNYPPSCSSCPPLKIGAEGPRSL